MKVKAPNSLFITVWWDRPEFHGLRDSGTIDWPPSPARLVGALVSGAHQLSGTSQAGSLQAIDRLLTAPAPLIHVPRMQPLGLPRTYAQSSGLDIPGAGTKGKIAKFLDTSLLGMDTVSRTAKPVEGGSIDYPVVVFEVDLEPTQELIDALQQAARGVGYFGRSNDPAQITVNAKWPDGIGRDDLTLLRPFPATYGRTRGWTPQLRQWMNANYDRIFNPSGGTHLPLPPLPPDGFIQPLSYAATANATALEIQPLPRSVPSHRIPRLFAALREEAGDAFGASVDIFPVVNAGLQRADGRALGVGFTPRVTGPEGQDTAEARLAVQVVGSEVAPLLGEAPLRQYQTGPVPQDSAWTLNPKRWHEQSRHWVSATPYRGFPDPTVIQFALTSEIERRFALPVEVASASMNPVASWEHRWPQDGFGDGLCDWWVTLRFDQEITGPVLMHDNQTLGTGVFVAAPVEQVRPEGGQEVTRGE